MIKKLIVVVMLIATLGIGSVTYAQATGGTTKTWNQKHPRQHQRTRHRRHRRGKITPNEKVDQTAKGRNRKKP